MTADSSHFEAITRREAIRRVAAALGSIALVGQSAMLASCDEGSIPQQSAVSELFDTNDIALLNEIAETILPETSTPGAKAVGVGAFMALMVADSYYPGDQAIFREGLAAINAASREANGADFLAATAVDRLALLERLDSEQFRYSNNRTEQQPPHFFRMMKELALLGYFTSEIGYTQAMRYTETPARFDPCVPLEPGGKIWAD